LDFTSNKGDTFQRDGQSSSGIKSLNIHRHCQLYEPLWIMVSTNFAFVSIRYVVIQLVAQFNILKPRGFLPVGMA